MSVPVLPHIAPARSSLLHAVPLVDAAGYEQVVGGKSCQLSRMLGLGVTVPAGFVLTTHAFDAWLDANGLREPIARLRARLVPRDLESARACSAAIHAVVSGVPLVEPDRDRLHFLAAGLSGGGLLVVRSSAVGEDSVRASFAGQFDSFPGVRAEPAALEQAVLGCWASYWSERALAYQAARGIAPSGMAVLIQRQVAAHAAGILFTRAEPGRMLVEYGPGLGDALASGRTNPGRFAILRGSHRVIDRSAPEEAVPGDGGLLFEPARIAGLARTGLLLERELGGPQDIEWAMDAGGAIHYVQSRPITVGPRDTEPPAAPRLASPREPGLAGVLWSNANIAENFPEPVSPLLYSIASAGYTHYFRNLALAFGIAPRRVRAMEPAFRSIIGAHGARLYYNLTSIHAVLRMAPFGAALTGAFNRFVGASGTAPPPPGASAFADGNRFERFRELGVIAVRTAWQYLFLGRRITRFEQRAGRFAALTHPARLAAMSTAELRAALQSFLEIRCHRWTEAALADAAAMACYGVLQHLISRSFPGAEQGALHNTLLKALPDLVSGKPARDLWILSRMIRQDEGLASLFASSGGESIARRLAGEPRFAAFHSAVDRYLETWGFRCSAELMLTTPSFQEAPAPLMDILGAYARLEGESPEHAMRVQEAERVAETARVLRRLRGGRVHPRIPWPDLARVVRVALAWTQASVLYRERARHQQALLYSRCRRVALALGERLADAGILEESEDVFFLTCEELDALAGGRAMFPLRVPEMVALRRREHAELSAMRPPDTFTLPEGRPWTPECPGQEGEPSDRSRDGTDELAGTGACGGRATGRAIILHDVSEAGKLTPGSILVTRQTDPGWSPVFFIVRGLVIERGGMLSHGAIVAREFGIPCVVGVRDATERITSGQPITVDGDRGRVWTEPRP